MSTANNADGVHVYTGVWTNYAHDRISGATLTLTQQHGALLNNFLAIFVSFAGGMCWKLLCFILHQMNATRPGRTEDLVHHQRQVILRNNGGPGSALVEFAMLPLAWRGKARKPILRVTAFAAVALLNIALFSAASILTAEVTRAAGNSTIIMGPQCGGWGVEGNNTAVEFETKVLADMYESAVYVRQCYGDNPTSLSCGLYAKPNLGFKMNPNATCPFAKGLCVGGDRSAFAMDTGMLDSYYDLGVNTPPSDRVKFRRVTTCAPLHGKTFPVFNQNDTAYIFAGPNIPENYTFAASIHSLTSGFGYQLNSVLNVGGSKVQSWISDPQLNRSDADVTFMMLNQNSIGYAAPCDDPLFSAHAYANDVNTTGAFGLNNTQLGLKTDQIQSFIGDKVGNLLACTDQYQVCNSNPSEPSCTELTGAIPPLLDIVSKVQEGLKGSPLGWSATQGWIAENILGKVNFMNMYYVVHGRGASALNAQERVVGQISAPLPNNQWQTEVKIWYMTGLARLQAYMVEWATAPTNLNLAPGVSSGVVRTVPKDPTQLGLCSRQLVRDAGSHVSFSILGVAIILVLGGIIILLGLTIDTVVGWLQIGTKSEYRRTQWVLEEKLRLQRAAYEGVDGVDAEWDDYGKGAGPLPTMRNGRMGVPPSSDVFLPRAPQKGMPEAEGLVKQEMRTSATEIRYYKGAEGDSDDIGYHGAR